MKLSKEFREKCSHCDHAAEQTPCCFCSDYIHRSGNVIMRASVPIVIHDVTPEADDE